MPLAREHATTTTLADITAADLRDYLRRLGVGPRVVSAVVNQRINGAALGELNADGDIERILGLTGHDARQVERIRRKVMWNPSVVNALSPVEREAAKGVDLFYRRYQPDRVGHGVRIVGCYADDPRFFYTKLSQKYGVGKDALAFLRPLFKEKANRDERMGEYIEALEKVLTRRGIPEDAETLLRGNCDAPQVLIDHLGVTYYVPPAEVRFLTDWMNDMAREEQEKDIAIPHFKPAPPPPTAERPEDLAEKTLLMARPFSQGTPGSGSALDREEVQRLLDVLRVCRDELRARKDASARHDERVADLLGTIGTLESERDQYRMGLEKMTVKAADMEARIHQQRRQIEVLELAQERMRECSTNPPAFSRGQSLPVPF
eukprot:TRINITY_DN13378_c0_g2_i1.p1 TRINITY_DN13378_c0_g2~~TRINITY_DN13378_c0_g2_i1.p1  ORF type:complete len:376 (+),score=129.30 TRINITY_DN13378_c0_g2_i1:67-1194(+)